MADEARDGYERVDGGCVLCVEGGEVVGAAGGGADGRAGEAVVRGGPCDAGGEVGAVGNLILTFNPFMRVFINIQGVLTLVY